MKKIKILAICLSLGISLSYAQQKQIEVKADAASVERAQKTVARLQQELNLTSPQQDSIYKYMLQRSAPNKGLREQSKVATRERSAKMQDTREEHRTRIKSFLTPEQIEKFDAMDKQRNTRRIAKPAK